MRKNITYIVLIIFHLNLLTSCEQDIEVTFEEVESRLVVDGWIENNRHPVVILTKSAPYFSKVDSASFRDLVETTAKVTVSTDQEKEILTLTRDDSYFPPYIYRGYKMKGEPGKEYQLEIEIREETYYAATSIVPPPEIDSIWFERLERNDSVGSIKVGFTEDPDRKNFYRVFSKVQGLDDGFVPVYGSTFSDNQINGMQLILPVYRGTEANFERNDNIYYSVNDTIFVKISSINEEAYKFWQNYQIEKINAANPFAASAKNLEGNISGNALGIWAGYGIVTYRIIPLR